MAHEVAVVLLVVVGDDIDSAAAQLRDLRGRELGGVPGSWVSRVAVHADLDALRDRLRVTAEPTAGAGTEHADLYLPLDLTARSSSGVIRPTAVATTDDAGEDDPDRELDGDREDDPSRPLR